MLSRDAGKSIIGGGGRYSYIHVLHHLFSLKAIVFTVCEHEYMNIPNYRLSGAPGAIPIDELNRLGPVV